MGACGELRREAERGARLADASKKLLLRRHAGGAVANGLWFGLCVHTHCGRPMKFYETFEGRRCNLSQHTPQSAIPRSNPHTAVLCLWELVLRQRNQQEAARKCL